MASFYCSSLGTTTGLLTNCGHTSFLHYLDLGDDAVLDDNDDDHGGKGLLSQAKQRQLVLLTIFLLYLDLGDVILEDDDGGMGLLAPPCLRSSNCCGCCCCCASPPAPPPACSSPSLVGLRSEEVPAPEPRLGDDDDDLLGDDDRCLSVLGPASPAASSEVIVDGGGGLRKSNKPFPLLPRCWPAPLSAPTGRRCRLVFLGEANLTLSTPLPSIGPAGEETALT